MAGGAGNPGWVAGVIEVINLMPYVMYNSKLYLSFQ
jgi:hypothetical protein